MDMDVPQVSFFKMILDKKYITQEVYDKITYKNAMRFLEV